MSTLISIILGTTIAFTLILFLKILELIFKFATPEDYMWIFILPAIFAFVAVTVPLLKNQLGL